VEASFDKSSVAVFMPIPTLPSLNAGISGKQGQPIRLEHAFILPPPDDPCWIGFDIIFPTDSSLRSFPAIGKAFHIG